MLSDFGHIYLINTFNWVLGASETKKIKLKKASGPLFHPFIPQEILLEGTASVQMTPRPP